MLPEPSFQKPNQSLVGNSKIGGRQVELDVRASMVEEEGKVADISLGRHCLRWVGSVSAVMG